MLDAGPVIGGRAARGAVAVLVVSILGACGMAGEARAAGARLEVTPTIGWQWGGTLDGYESNGVALGGDIHVDAALNYGGAIGAQIRPGEWAEIGYSYQGSEVFVRPAAAPKFKAFDLATHYIQASGGRILVKGADPTTMKAYPYVIGGLGMTIFSPGSIANGVSVNTGTQYLFSLSAGGGLRVNMSEKFDLRFQARLLLPLNFESGGFYFGTGGAGVGVSGGSSMPQGEATLGLTFKQTRSTGATN